MTSYVWYGCRLSDNNTPGILPLEWLDARMFVGLRERFSEEILCLISTMKFEKIIDYEREIEFGEMGASANGIDVAW